ncbi:MAG: hypothetical protein JNN13_11585 [Planctomycetes bacterium]|nr:hypothetical protein [Planctomycetota bacterium]
MGNADVRAPAPRVQDRWRTVLLVLLALSLVAVAFEMVPATWRFVAAWAGDASLRAITRPLWFLCTPVALTLAELGLLAGAVLALRRHDEAASRRSLLVAFGVYFVLQIVPRLVPLRWSYAWSADLQEQGRQILAKAAPFDAVAGVLDLVPLLLAFTLGLLRAGTHQAHRHPGHAAGPVLAFAAAAQLAALAALGLAGAGPLYGDGLLVVGLVLLTLHFVVVALVWSLRAASVPRGGAALLFGATLLLQLPGWCALLLGLEQVELLGKHLVAIGGREGLVELGELPRHAAHFVARTCVMALAGNDMIERLRAARG